MNQDSSPKRPSRRQLKWLLEVCPYILPYLSKENLKRAAQAPDTPLFKSKITYNEYLWLLNLENLEYLIKRGRGKDALEATGTISPTLPIALAAEIYDEIETLKRCTQKRADTLTKHKKKSRKTNRKPPSSTYCADDWIDVSGKVKTSLREELYGGELQAADPRDRVSSLRTDANAYGSEKQHIKAGFNPDQAAVTNSTEDCIIEALDKANKNKQPQKRDLDSLMERAKIDGNAQRFWNTWSDLTPAIGCVYIRYGYNLLDFEILVSDLNGRDLVLDRHGRLQKLEVFLARCLEDSVVSHCEVSYIFENRLDFWGRMPGKEGQFADKIYKMPISLRLDETPFGVRWLLVERNRRVNIFELGNKSTRTEPLAFYRLSRIRLEEIRRNNKAQMQEEFEDDFDNDDIGA